ncbi:response regulator transcription factor [Paraflavitalea speifideaquila]|uniref:LytR/AlgR family response regulator transcription factor n=1 Tax=Paraflavitalea speifideaquila TaxID=3076558 RepID=UPI0028E1B920|nr:response regulator transcription factor [Paraflavitalea speifideiaquila]
MEALKILVIEDNEADAGIIMSLLQQAGYNLCGIARSLREAIQLFNNTQPDLCIIDIYLQGRQDGIEFARQLSNHESLKRPFIFLTSATDKQTFDTARMTNPFSYLLKPFNALELQYAIELAVEKFGREKDGYFATSSEPASILLQDVFFVKRGNILVKIMASEIRYIEVDGKYCKLAYGTEKFVIQKSLKQLQEQLPLKTFVRTHRNYIVNVKEIVKINLQDHELVLQDGNTLAFSRRYLDELTQAFSVLK